MMSAKGLGRVKTALKGTPAGELDFGAVAAEGRPMTTVADVIGVSRSNLAERLKDSPYEVLWRATAPDDQLVADITAVIAEPRIYGYRRVLPSQSDRQWLQA
jgi:hypothetical protein